MSDNQPPSLAPFLSIVADSVAENEYFETIHKASALYDAIRRAELRSGTPGGAGEELS